MSVWKTTPAVQVARTSRWLAGWLMLVILAVWSGSPITWWVAAGLVVAVAEVLRPLASKVRIAGEEIVVDNVVRRRRVDRSKVTAVVVKDSSMLGPVAHLRLESGKTIRCLGLGAGNAQARSRVEEFAVAATGSPVDDGLIVGRAA